MPESKPPGQVRLGVSPSEREIKLLLVGVKVLRCAEKTAAGNRNSDWLRGLLASLKAKAVKIRFALRRNIKPSHGLGGRLLSGNQLVLQLKGPEDCSGFRDLLFIYLKAAILKSNQSNLADGYQFLLSSGCVGVTDNARCCFIFPNR